MGVKWLNSESPLLSLKTLYTFNSIITKLLQYVGPTALYTWQTIKFLPFQPVNCYLWYSDTAGEIQLCLCKSNKANIKYKMKAGELHFSSRPAKDWTTHSGYVADHVAYQQDFLAYLILDFPFPCPTYRQKCTFSFNPGRGYTVISAPVIWSSWRSNLIALLAVESSVLYLQCNKLLFSGSNPATGNFQWQNIAFLRDTVPENDWSWQSPLEIVF